MLCQGAWGHGIAIFGGNVNVAQWKTRWAMTNYTLDDAPPIHGVVFAFVLVYLWGTSGSCQHGANSHFSGGFQVLVQCTKISFRRGGGGMCMLFEICEKRPFQKCMGWGGGGRWSQF